MSKGFLARVEKVVANSDIVLEVLDARFPNLTRNAMVENLVKRHRKQLVLVLNKSDLVSKKMAENWKRKFTSEYPVIFVSSTEKNGASFLRNLIGSLSRGERSRVAAVGYPNTGKSSIINLLCGRHAARTSSTAGFTRGEQLINVTKTLSVWDSPGVIPFEEEDPFTLVMIGCKNPNQVKDAESIAMQLFEWVKRESPESITKWGLDLKMDGEEMLEAFAVQRNKLKKGGLPDTKTAAALLLQSWQSGKILL